MRRDSVSSRIPAPIADLPTLDDPELHDELAGARNDLLNCLACPLIVWRTPMAITTSVCCAPHRTRAIALRSRCSPASTARTWTGSVSDVWMCLDRYARNAITKDSGWEVTMAAYLPSPTMLSIA